MKNLSMKNQMRGSNCNCKFAGQNERRNKNQQTTNSKNNIILTSRGSENCEPEKRCRKQSHVFVSAAGQEATNSKQYLKSGGL
jgi:hypothetical protein